MCYLNGMHPKEISKRFGIAENTIYTKIGKAGWYKIKKEAIAQEPQPKAVEELAQILEEDWKSKGAAHRSMMYEIAHKALKSASLPAPRSWKDAQIADNIARKAVGLDDEKGAQAVVNIAWSHETLGGPMRMLDNDVVDVDFVNETDSESGVD